MDLIEFIRKVKEYPSKKEQVIKLHEYGFTNREIAGITGSTKNSVDWYISKHRQSHERNANRAAREADKALTRLHNVELNRNKPC